MVRPVRAAAVSASRITSSIAFETNTDWSNNALISMPLGAAALMPGRAVAHVGDVLHPDRDAVHDLDRDAVEVGQRARRRVQADRVLVVAELREARGHDHVLVREGGDDVERRKAVGLQRMKVEVDLDLARRAAVGRGQRRAGCRDQRLADAVLRVVVHGRAALGRGGEGELDHRLRGGGEAQHHRRLDARRQHGADRVDGGDHLRHRQVDGDGGGEVNLLDRGALERLALEPVDVVDVVGEAELAVGGDAARHVGRVEAGVGPHDHHHRDVDDRQHVLDRHEGGAEAAEQHQHAQHEEGHAVLQGIENQSHTKSRSCRRGGGRRAAAVTLHCTLDERTRQGRSRHREAREREAALCRRVERELVRYFRWTVQLARIRRRWGRCIWR